ncbi:MAG: hypothetical protein HOW97_02250 [Catenulispora sp.]|nr:hypothetical protein [Catenulispora sp.]
MSAASRQVLFANIKRPSTAKQFARSYLSGLGLIAGISGLGSGLFPDFAKRHGVPFLIGALALALVYALWAAYPRLSFDRAFTMPRTKVSIVVGDLFTQDGHLVIGMTDTFDTETPQIISERALQGQLLAREYGGDLAALDADVTKALAATPVTATESRTAKPLGKLDRYPLGTVAVLGSAPRRYYGLAYSRMSNACVAESSVTNVWNSLMRLWPVVRDTADLGTVSITAMGMGLARLSGQITQADIVRLIIISFLTASRETVVTSHLRIVLSPDAAEQTDLKALRDYLNAQ